ncbi:hypothetical protein PK35_11975 [Tamlana nanhaiensis]|uniref:Sulfotransferase domain-containing protein n=1 Tax=Neotamlana nanhaiensis TaxID=1382798 RepID=A0A0D7VZB8_9FLAO|nr:hypothetical protein [Tamlana nanhaiensis]KJD32144.1 hypothetical protein PK35_11090 [Tamlana nanhaiensis]KJD32306.1 hypothetical protein PK35_11975 [Tamlana nanhaiensis]
MQTLTKNNQPEVFFHVGTAKTGTTFLQYRVFPKLKGLFYIQRTRYKKSIKIISKGAYKRYLVSRELDRRVFESEVQKFAKAYPDTLSIIVFRRHDSYIASEYRRYVKNGFTGSFKDFFDVENDSGYFKKLHMDYDRQIKILETNFNKKPLVLVYNDLKNDSKAFIGGIANALNTTVNLSDLDLSRKHKSYSEKQLKAMQFVGKYVNMTKRRKFKNGVLNLFWKLYLGGLRYGILHGARLLPDSMFTKEPLIDKKELKAVKKYYKTEWKACKAYSTRLVTDLSQVETLDLTEDLIYGGI